METRANHFLIGIFTLALLTGIILSLTWLNNSNKSSSFVPYDIIFNEAVTGLNKGSLVEFNGIRIGEVNSLGLDQKNPQRVIARVLIDPNTPVRQDTKAKLISSGITGLSIIRLSSGEDINSAPLLSENGIIPKIHATPSSLSKLLSNGESLITLLNDLTIQVKELLSAENQQNTAEILQNLKVITKNLSNKDEQITNLLQEANLASKEATKSFKSSAELFQTTHKLIEEQGAETFNLISQTLSSTDKTFNLINEALIANQEDLNQSFSGFAELGPALIEMRVTLESFRQITGQLETGPGQYLFNATKMQEYKHD